MIQPGIPRKVLREAHRLGVHNDCIASERPCVQCSARINRAFHTFYSHCETEHEMYVAIMNDFRQDIIEEEQL